MKLKKIISIPALVFILAVLCAPTTSYGAPTDETKTGKTGITYECEGIPVGGTKVVPGECDFRDLADATLKIVDYGVTFALSFSVVVLVYAGYKFGISGDIPGERAKAKQMLWSVLTGIVVIMCAWLIVTLVTSNLLTGEVSGTVNKLFNK